MRKQRLSSHMYNREAPTGIEEDTTVHEVDTKVHKVA
jgi:hypothetical protein